MKIDESVGWVGVQCVSSENHGVEGQYAGVGREVAGYVSICKVRGGRGLGQVYTEKSL